MSTPKRSIPREIHEHVSQALAEMELEDAGLQASPQASSGAVAGREINLAPPNAKWYIAYKTAATIVKAPSGPST